MAGWARLCRPAPEEGQVRSKEADSCIVSSAAGAHVARRGAAVSWHEEVGVEPAARSEVAHPVRLLVVASAVAVSSAWWGAAEAGWGRSWTGRPPGCPPGWRRRTTPRPRAGAGGDGLHHGRTPRSSAPSAPATSPPGRLRPIGPLDEGELCVAGRAGLVTSWWWLLEVLRRWRLVMVVCRLVVVVLQRLVML